MATSPRQLEDSRVNAVDRMGRTVVYQGELLRHRVYTRFLHWMVGIFFFLALLSGFAIYTPWIFRWVTPLFGGGPMTRFLHPWFGVGFVTFFSLQFFNWLQPMKWTPADSRWIRRLKSYIRNEELVEPEDTGFFNAGQKLQFWEIAGGCVAYLITGVIIWFPEIFGRIAVAVSYVIHDISALIMLAGIFVHVYLSTIGEPHTFQAMTKGTVSEPWAWTHHPAWYRAVTGRDPRQALEQERRRMTQDRTDLGPESGPGD